MVKPHFLGIAKQRSDTGYITLTPIVSVQQEYNSGTTGVQPQYNSSTEAVQQQQQQPNNSRTTSPASHTLVFVTVTALCARAFLTTRGICKFLHTVAVYVYAHLLI